LRPTRGRQADTLPRRRQTPRDRPRERRDFSTVGRRERVNVRPRGARRPNEPLPPASRLSLPVGVASSSTRRPASSPRLVAWPLRKAPEISRSALAEVDLRRQLCGTTSRPTTRAQGTGWRFSEPTLRSDSAASVGVCATATWPKRSCVAWPPPLSRSAGIDARAALARRCPPRRFLTLPPQTSGLGRRILW